MTSCVTLLTDFGLQDPYVGILRGSVLRECPAAHVVDLCHDVPSFGIDVGAMFLGAAVGRFPPGSVHVAVVDPGVGSARRILAARCDGDAWIAPDNGLLTRILSRPGAESRVVDADALGLSPESSTFHGRDVMGPLGGRLAAGQLAFDDVGRRCEDPVVLTGDASVDEARVVLVDKYGNAITSLTAADVTGASSIEVAGHTVPMGRTYADAERGAALALVNSYGLVEIAVREGHAARQLSIERGARVGWTAS